MARARGGEGCAWGKETHLSGRGGCDQPAGLPPRIFRFARASRPTVRIWTDAMYVPGSPAVPPSSSIGVMLHGKRIERVLPNFRG
eukprot:scaffold1016_cov132-Isochrysis_galbana.AAC.1